jgi:general secretion pathway protein D
LLVLSLATVLGAQPSPSPATPSTPPATAPKPPATPSAPPATPSAPPATPSTPPTNVPAAPVQIPSRNPTQATRRASGPPAFPTLPKPPVETAPAPALPVNPPAMGAVGTNRVATMRGEDVADIHYDFPAIPVPQLLEIYADLVGRTLLYSSSGPAAVPATATVAIKTESDLTHSEAIEAIETVLGMNGVTIVPIGEKFAKVVMEAAAPKAGGVISSNYNLPEAGKFVTEIVQVKYTDVQDLAKVLDPFSRMASSIIALPSTQTLILRDYTENVARMMEMVKRIDVQGLLTIKPRVIAIRYALASDIASALGQLGASAGGSVGKPTSGSTSFNRGSGNGFSGAGGVGGSTGFGNSSVPGQPASTSALGSAATSARSSFQQNLSKIVSNAANAGTFQLFGQTKVIADERTNSLLVFANDEDMKMITNIIDKLDVVLAQVLIDTIIMEVNLTGTESQGVSYSQPQNTTGRLTGVGGVNNLTSAASGFLTGSASSNSASGGPLGGGGSTLASLPGGFSYFGKFGNDLNVVLEAVAGDSRVNVLSRPRIQTSHAVQADLFIGQTVPYITGTYNYGYSSGPSSQYSQLEVGIHLQVMPLINPDGLVVMDIQADVEQIANYVQISGNAVPTTSKRQAGAKVAVRDGETIILGGFISDTRSKSDSGVPGLKDIPLLGNLFKSKSINNQRDELIMLMRPTVLKTPAIAAVVATTERNKLAGVKAAELEIREEESDRYKALEAQMAKDAARRAKTDAEKAAAAPVAQPTNSLEDEYLNHYLQGHPLDGDTNAPVSK